MDFYNKIVSFNTRLDRINDFLKDDSKTFNILEKADNAGETEYDKMKKWIINKHKSMIEEEKLRRENEIRRKNEEEERKKREEEEKRNPKSKVDTSIYQEKDITTVETFVDTNVDYYTISRMAVNHSTKYRNLFQIVSYLENDIQPLLGWVAYVSDIRKKERKERFLNYQRMATMEMNDAERQANPQTSQTVSLPYKQNVISRLSYQLKLDDKPRNVSIIQPTELINFVQNQEAQLISLEKRVYTYDASVDNIYELYQSEVELEQAKVGKATDIAKEKHRMEIDKILQDEAPSGPPTMDTDKQSAGSNALLGTITGSSNDMNISKEEKQQTDKNTSGAVGNIQQSLAKDAESPQTSEASMNKSMFE